MNTTTWIDHPPKQVRRARVHRQPVPINYGLVATVIVMLGLGVFALTRIRWDAMGAPSLDSAAVAWAGWFLVIPAWVGGQLWRGIQHARGIGKSHFHAVVGKTLALALLVWAVLLIAGGG